MRDLLTKARLPGCCLTLGILLVPLMLSGCANPIGVTRVSPQESYNQSTASALGTDRLSESSKAVLERYNLMKTLDDPTTTIRQLNDICRTDERRDLLFTLSEVSYLHGLHMLGETSAGIRGQAQDVFLQSAVYAYFYLLDEGRQPPPAAYDSRFRNARDLYNRSLWQSFPAAADGSLRFSEGVRHLPAGDLPLSVRTDTLAWDFNEFEGLFPADSYAVHGFIVRNRSAGLGLPLVGLTRKSPQSPNGGALPISAFLKMDCTFREYLQGKCRASLEMYSALDDFEVRVHDRPVPLETDITTPLAYKLNDASLWRLGEKRFLTGSEIPVRVLLIQPYEPGRIPVVFVHGTASSPVWWAEMLNSLRGDPQIRKNFQFWFYQYNSSNMVMLSAAELRKALVGMVDQLDPQHKNPALQDMVVIGHSQGGLLAKMTVVDSGDKLWNAISDQPIDESGLDPKVRDFAARLLVFQPLPFVKRVVFISTPHRGSYLTHEWVRNFIRKVVTLPYDMVVNSQEFLSTLRTKFKLPESMQGKIPTSIDGMSEENPLLRALVSLPTAPGVAAHSIIAVKPGMDIATGDDGVVSYASAHIAGVESEYIVRAEHSCQGHPFTIEEVRRILLEHIGRQKNGQTMASAVDESSGQGPAGDGKGQE